MPTGASRRTGLNRCAIAMRWHNLGKCCSSRSGARFSGLASRQR
jgi:hypothetical protein